MTKHCDDALQQFDAWLVSVADSWDKPQTPEALELFRVARSLADALRDDCICPDLVNNKKHPRCLIHGVYPIKITLPKRLECVKDELDALDQTISRVFNERDDARRVAEWWRDRAVERGHASDKMTWENK